MALDDRPLRPDLLPNVGEGDDNEGQDDVEVAEDAVGCGRGRGVDAEGCRGRVLHGALDRHGVCKRAKKRDVFTFAVCKLLISAERTLTMTIYFNFKSVFLNTFSGRFKVVRVRGKARDRG